MIHNPPICGEKAFILVPAPFALCFVLHPPICQAQSCLRFLRKQHSTVLALVLGDGRWRCHQTFCRIFFGDVLAEGSHCHSPFVGYFGSRARRSEPTQQPLHDELFQRPCSQIEELPQLLHLFLLRPCSQVGTATTALSLASLAAVLSAHRWRSRRSSCSSFFGGRAHRWIRRRSSCKSFFGGRA